MNMLERALYPVDGNGKITVKDIIDEVPGGGESTPVTVDTLTGATTTGKAVMKAASQEAARTAIGAGTSDFSGSYEDLTGKPTIPAAATVDNLGGAGATGKEVMKATSAEAARTAIGAGTSNLTIGSTAQTAKAGNYTPTWNEVTGKPAVIAAGADQAAARAAIGAGTSNLTIGTTAETAKAGNYTPPVVTTSANGLMTAADKIKLNEIAENATANSTDAQLRDRSTHTGVQDMSTISGLAAALEDKATVAALAALEARIEALENPE